MKKPIFLFWGIMLAVAMVFTATPAMAESVPSVPVTTLAQAVSWPEAAVEQAAEEPEQAVEEPEQGAGEPEQAAEEEEQAAEEEEQAAEEEEQAAEPRSRPLSSRSRLLSSKRPSNIRLTSSRAVTPTPSTPVPRVLFR